MRFRLILPAALLLIPLPALGIGYVYTGVGGDGRQHLAAVGHGGRAHRPSGR